MNEKIDKDIRMTTIPTWMDCSIPGRKNPYAPITMNAPRSERWKMFHQDIRDNQVLASK